MPEHRHGANLGNSGIRSIERLPHGKVVLLAREAELRGQGDTRATCPYAGIATTLCSCRY
jgi:hypothetical protein